MHHKRVMSILLVLIMLASSFLPGQAMPVSASEMPLELVEKMASPVTATGLDGEISLTFNQPIEIIPETPGLSQIVLYEDTNGDGKGDISGVVGGTGILNGVLSVSPDNPNKVLININGYLSKNKHYILAVNVPTMYPCIRVKGSTDRLGDQTFSGIGDLSTMTGWAVSTFPAPGQPDHITLDGNTVLAAGASISLSALVEDIEGNKVDTSLSWSVSDENIASVSTEGVVTGKVAGTVTVTAALANGLSANHTIRVEKEENYDISILYKITHGRLEGNDLIGTKVQDGLVYAVRWKSSPRSQDTPYENRVTFYAYDLSGNKLWENSPEEKIAGINRNYIPTVEDRSIYIQCSSLDSTKTYLYALNSDGSSKWEKPVTVEEKCIIGTKPVLYKEQVIITTQKGVYSVDKESGEIQWHYSAGGSITYAPALAGENLLLAMGKEIRVLSTESGSERWSAALNNASGNSLTNPAVSEDGTVYAADGTGTVYAYDLETGQQKAQDSRNGLQAAENPQSAPQVKIGPGNILYLCYSKLLGSKQESYLKTIYPDGSTGYTYQSERTFSAWEVDKEGYVYYQNYLGLQGGYAILVVSPLGAQAGAIGGYGSSISNYYNLSIEGNTLVGGRDKNGEFIIASITRGSVQKAQSIELTGKRQLGLYMEETTGAIVRNANGEAISGTQVEWTSSDPSIIEVVNKDGKYSFKGKKEGSAVLTAKVKGTQISASASYMVVRKASYPTSVKFFDAQGNLSDGSFTVPYGESYTYTYMVYDQYGNPMPEEGLNYNNNQTGGDIMGGSYTRAYTKDETETYWCINNVDVTGTVTVTVQKEEGELASIHPGETSLNPGESIQLGTYDQYGSAYALSGAEWESSDKEIAEVDQTGKVTGAAAGTAVITVKSQGVSKSCTVEVVDTFGYAWQTPADTSTDERWMVLDSQGRICSVTRDAGVYTLRCTDSQGNICWQALIRYQPLYLASFGDKVYCLISGSEKKQLICLDSQGKTVWTKEWEDTSDALVKNLLTDGSGNLYVTDTDTLYCLDAFGRQQWSLALESSIQNFIFDQEGNLLAVTSKNGKTHVYTIKNAGQEGRVLSDDTFDLTVYGTPAEMIVDKDGTLYLTCELSLAAIRDGEILWTYDYGVEDGLSSYSTYKEVKNFSGRLRLELVEGILYAVTQTTDQNVLSAEGPSYGVKLYMLNAATGECLKALALNDLIAAGYAMTSVGDFAVDADGTAYFPLTLMQGKTYKSSLVLAIDKNGKAVKRITYPASRFGSMRHILLGEDSLYVLSVKTDSTGSSSNGYLIKFPLENNQEPVADTVVISSPKTSVVVGNSIQLSASVYSQLGGVMKDEQVRWESSDTDIAAVDDNGKITGISSGIAVIKVSSISNPSVAASFSITIQEAGKYFLSWNQISAQADKTVNFYKKTGVSGDWIAFALWAVGENINDPIYYYGGKSYVSQTWDVVSAARGNLSVMTDYERMSLGIMAAGYDPSNFAGYNLIKSIYNYPSLAQGNNAVMWGLIALNMAGVSIPEDAKWNQKYLIDYLLDHKVGGGWNYSGDSPDTDMTAMAIYALAPYYEEQADVKESVNEAVEWLKSVQNENGSFNCFGGKDINTESTAQVIMALCSIGIDPQSEDFTRSGGNPVTALLSMQLSDGQFEHVKDIGADGLATNQALQAIGALKQFYEKGISTIFSEITYYRDNPVEAWMELIEDINLLPEDTSLITLADEKQIQELRSRYEALSSEEKAQVSSIDRLLAVEKRILVLKDKTPPTLETDLVSQTVSQKKFTFRASLTDDVSTDLTTVVSVNGMEVKGVGGLYAVSLNPGENLIVILGMDENGNQIKKTFIVIYQLKEESASQGTQTVKTGGKGTQTTETASSTVDAIQQGILEKIRNTPEGGTLAIQSQEEFKLTPDILAALKEKNMTVIVDRGDCSISFNTSQITGTLKEGKEINFNISFASENVKSIEKAFGGENTLILHFDYHGELPVPFTVRVKLPQELAGKSPLYLYYYNQDSGRLEQLDTEVTMEGGYAQFGITHCSDYVLSDISLKTVDDSEVKKSEIFSDDEKKGRNWGLAAGAAAIIAVAALGAGIAYKRKKAR